MLVKGIVRPSVIKRVYTNQFKTRIEGMLETNNRRLFHILCWGLVVWELADKVWYDYIGEIIKILSASWLLFLNRFQARIYNELKDILVHSPENIFSYDMKTWCLTRIEKEGLFEWKKHHIKKCRCIMWFRNRWCSLFKLGSKDCPVQTCLNAGQMLDYNSGHYRIVSYPVLDQNWEITSITIKIKDVRVFHEHGKSLRETAETDPKTWLFNDRGLIASFLDKYMKPRNTQKISVCFIDLDRFKDVNDNYWHNMWDEVLKEVAARLLKSVRREDIVVRPWWDEFLIVFGNIDEANLSRRIESIEDILKQPFEIDWHIINISWSVWYASSEFDPLQFQIGNEEDVSSAGQDHIELWECVSPLEKQRDMVSRRLKELVSVADKRMYGVKNWEEKGGVK